MVIVERRSLPPARRTREERATSREKVRPLGQNKLRKPQSMDSASLVMTPSAAEQILFKPGGILAK